MPLLSSTLGRRIRLGVLIPDIDGEYYRPLVDGVCQEAFELNVDLIFYPGHAPGTSVPFDQQWAAAYELVDPTQLDGLLVIASALQVYLDAESMREFLGRFKQVPVVCVGYEYDDWPSVMLDNRGGFRKLVDHFIVEHAYADRDDRGPRR